jgi:hypothetical protein
LSTGQCRWPLRNRPVTKALDTAFRGAFSAVMNELSMTDQETILGLLRLGWSARRVERQTGHRRETIARYGMAAGLIRPKPANVGEVATDSSAQSESEIQPKPA